MSQRRKRLKPSAPTAAAASNAHLGAWDPAWEPRAITASNEDHLVWDPDPDPPPDPDPVHARFLRQLEMMTREKGLIFDFLGGRFAHTPDSDEESEARRLLAETLRYGRSLDERIRWRLAAMIEDPPPAGELWKVVIEPRGRLSKDFERQGDCGAHPRLAYDRRQANEMGGGPGEARVWRLTRDHLSCLAQVRRSGQGRQRKDIKDR